MGIRFDELYKRVQSLNFEDDKRNDFTEPNTALLPIEGSESSYYDSDEE
jgi:hypothetical protein